MKTLRKVVVTGAGIISPIGIGMSSFVPALREGKCGAKEITSFDWPNFPVKRAYEVFGYEPKEHGVHSLDPFIQYAVSATTEAIASAGLDTNLMDPQRIGISVSSSKGGMHTLDRFGERLKRKPSAILGARVYTSAAPNFAAQWIARRWKLKGPAKCYIAACATGTVAIIEGARMVAEGTVDYCIAGASDASIVPLLLAGYRNMKALSNSEMRPFDRRRDGFLVGEGAGIVVLESEDSARARKAGILGRVLGHSYGNDPTDGLRFDEKDDILARTAGQAIERAGLGISDVGYVNLHGTGTKAGDVYETLQMKKLFGSAADLTPMSSTKSMTGHMLGASGAVEIIASLAAMNEGFLPPTIGLEEADPECDLDYVAKRSRNADVKHSLSVSMGFGGHVAAIVLGRGG